jgi:hypothetical protein
LWIEEVAVLAFLWFISHICLLYCSVLCICRALLVKLQLATWRNIPEDIILLNEITYSENVSFSSSSSRSVLFFLELQLPSALPSILFCLESSVFIFLYQTVSTTTSNNSLHLGPSTRGLTLCTSVHQFNTRVFTV